LGESGSILGVAVSAVSEVVAAFGFGELVEVAAAEFPELIDGSGSAVAK